MYNVHIGLTEKCNQNCKHCYARFRRDVATPKVNEQMLISCLEQIGTSIVTYTYGENLLYDNFFSFACKLKEKGFYQILISNGTLINSYEVIEKLEQSGIRHINISLDSVYESKHDANRGFNGSFKNAIVALELIKKSSITPQIAMAVTDNNYAEMMEVLSLGKNIGINSFSFMRKRTSDGLKLIDEKYYSTMKDVILFCMENNINLNIHDFTLNTMIKSLYEKDEISKEAYYKYVDMNSCHAYKDLLMITPSGEVYPCMFNTKSLGNIYTDAISNILINRKYECICKG